MSSCGINSFNTKEELTDFDYYKWTKVPLKAKSECSDGSDYFLTSKKGKSNNLIIHFAGGGACWDAETCMEPISIGGIFNFVMSGNLKEYYLRDVPNLLPVVMKGIFLNDKDKNPFKDWNVVYLPYCTGDLHVGNVNAEYTAENGKSVKVNHNGQNNVKAAMDWITAQYGNPDKILISGDSAGGFGSMMWTPTIANLYKEAKIFQLSDCFFFDSGEWSNRLNETWNVEGEKNFNIPAGDNLIRNVLTYCKENYPEITFLQINAIYDSVLGQFNGFLDPTDKSRKENIEAWSAKMLEETAEIEQSDIKYYYYITDYKLKKKKKVSPHTFITNSRFYGCTQDNIALKDWLKNCIIDDTPNSIGSKFFEMEPISKK